MKKREGEECQIGPIVDMDIEVSNKHKLVGRRPSGSKQEEGAKVVEKDRGLLEILIAYIGP